jgi:hypothetical protein
VTGAPNRARQRSISPAVSGPEPSSAINTSKSQSPCRDNERSTASSASVRSNVVTMMEIRVVAPLPLSRPRYALRRFVPAMVKRPGDR